MLNGTKVKIVGLGTTGSGRHIVGLHALTESIYNEIICHAAGSEELITNIKIHSSRNNDVLIEQKMAKYWYFAILNKIPKGINQQSNTRKLDSNDVYPRKDIHAKGQVPIVHEFGHWIGLHHPSKGLPGVLPNSPEEYTEPSTGKNSDSVMSTGDIIQKVS